jgi:hypothetical protein
MFGHMTKPKLGLISLLLIGVAVVPWLIQRQSDIKTINSLRTQLEQLTRQRAEDESSSQRMARAVSATPNEQLNELLRLRSEVNLLRKQTNELSRFRAENPRLPSDATAARPQGQPNLAAGDAVPVESLTFAGYATPEATFQSTFSAMAKGDFKTLWKALRGISENTRKKNLKENPTRSLQSWPPNQLLTSPISTVKIVAAGLVSEDQARLVIFSLGGRERKFRENEEN